MASIEITVTADSGTTLVVRRAFTEDTFDEAFKDAIDDVYMLMRK